MRMVKNGRVRKTAPDFSGAVGGIGVLTAGQASGRAARTPFVGATGDAGTDLQCAAAARPVGRAPPREDFSLASCSVKMGGCTYRPILSIFLSASANAASRSAVFGA